MWNSNTGEEWQLKSPVQRWTKMGPKQLGSHLGKKKVINFNPFLTLHTKISSKWISNIIVNSKPCNSQKDISFKRFYSSLLKKSETHNVFLFNLGADKGIPSINQNPGVKKGLKTWLHTTKKHLL